MSTPIAVPAADAREPVRVRFPYYNLETSADVARAIHSEAGGSCSRSQLASYLKYKSTDNGSFLTRVTAAKLFGYISQEGNQLMLTDLGRQIAAPIATNDAERAKAEAFLNVELFRKVFDAFDGQTLPSDLGLRNLLLTKYKLKDARVGPAIRVMLDSADQAGYFRSGDRSRMVKPILSSASGASVKSQTPAPPRDNSDQKQTGRGGGGGANGPDLSGIHPAIIGVLSALPAPGPMAASRREDLIALFTATVKVIYPNAEPSTA